MSDSLVSELRASLDWTYLSGRKLSTVRDRSRLSFFERFPSGDELGEANQIWYDERDVEDFTNDDLDLTGLPAILYGAPVSVAFTKVRAVLMQNLATDMDASLRLGGASSNAWSAWANAASSWITVGPGSCLLLSSRLADWNVSSANRILRITNAHEEPVRYRIAIIGVA